MIDTLVYYAPQLVGLMVLTGILIALVEFARLHKGRKYRLR